MRVGQNLVDEAIPEANGTRVLYDDGSKHANVTNFARGVLVLYTDQEVTIKTWWAKDASTTLRERTTTTATAGDITKHDLELLPGRNKLTVTAGATPPTVYEPALELTDDRSPSV